MKGKCVPKGDPCSSGEMTLACDIGTTCPANASCCARYDMTDQPTGTQCGRTGPEIFTYYPLCASTADCADCAQATGLPAGYMACGAP